LEKIHVPCLLRNHNGSAVQGWLLRSIQNLGAVGITIGPASPGTATNTTIIFNTNLPCSFSAGSVLLDLGNQKVGHLENIQVVSTCGDLV
jgi:hypothetical protein